MRKTLSFDLSWSTPEHYFGIASDVDQETIEEMVLEAFPNAEWQGSGGGFYSRDIDWSVETFLDQEALDKLGNAIAQQFPGREFRMSQTAWDFDNEDDALLEDECGPKGAYCHLPEGEDA